MSDPCSLLFCPSYRRAASLRTFAVSLESCNLEVLQEHCLSALENAPKVQSSFAIWKNRANQTVSICVLNRCNLYNDHQISENAPKVQSSFAIWKNRANQTVSICALNRCNLYNDHQISLAFAISRSMSFDTLLSVQQRKATASVDRN